MTIPFVNTSLSVIQRRPRWIGFGFAIAFLLWAGSIGYVNFFAPQPPVSDLTGQIIRLNATKLQAVTEDLATYRLVKEVPTIRNNLFANPAP